MLLFLLKLLLDFFWEWEEEKKELVRWFICQTASFLNQIYHSYINATAPRTNQIDCNKEC